MNEKAIEPVGQILEESDTLDHASKTIEAELGAEGLHYMIGLLGGDVIQSNERPRPGSLRAKFFKELIGDESD